MNSKFWYLDGTTSENNMDVTKQLHRVDGPAAVWDDNNSKNDNWTPEGEELCRKLLGREWIYE